MRIFHEIPDYDHLAAKAANGDFLMVDRRMIATARGRVFAKPFGQSPRIVSARTARSRGMRILGAVVGTYPRGRLQAERDAAHWNEVFRRDLQRGVG